MSKEHINGKNKVLNVYKKKIVMYVFCLITLTIVTISAYSFGSLACITDNYSGRRFYAYLKHYNKKKLKLFRRTKLSYENNMHRRRIINA